jgi:hypothetical protein
MERNQLKGNFPLTFRGITHLAKKHGVKLTPGQTVDDFKYNGCGCVLTTLAVANGLGRTFEVREGIITNDPNFQLKAMAIECGFEKWKDRWGVRSKNVGMFNRYYNVGLRLREYAGYSIK